MLVGCQQEETLTKERTGILSFGEVTLSSEIDVQTTKANDNVQLLYRIKKEDGTLVVEEKTFTTDSKSILNEGTYTLEMYSQAYNESSSWGSNNLGEIIYYASTTVNVTADSVNSVSITVPVVNFGVSFETNDFLNANFTDIKLNVTIGKRTTQLSDGETIYSLVGEKTFSYHISAKNAKNEEKSTNEKTEVDVTTGKIYKPMFYLSGSVIQDASN
jgi:hypothetical protein